MKNKENRAIEIIDEAIKHITSTNNNIYSFSEASDMVFAYIEESEILATELTTSMEGLDELPTKETRNIIIKQIKDFCESQINKSLQKPITRNDVINFVKGGVNFFDERLKNYHNDMGLILATYKYLLISGKHTNDDVLLFRQAIPNKIKNHKNFKKFMDGIYFSSYFPTIEQNVIQSIDIGNNLSKEELSNKTIVLSVIRHYPHIFAECSDELKNDRKFILKAMKINNNIFPYLPKHLKNDVDIAIMATDIEYFLSHITTAILQDKRIVQKFIHSKPSNIDYLQSSGKLNFDLYDDEMIYPFVESNTIAFNKLSKRLQNKKKFILAALSVKYPSSELFNELPLKFRKDRKIALKAIKKYETSYSHLCDSLKNNERFLLRALKENNDLAGVIVRENPQIFLNSKLLALYIVKKYNNAISFLSEDLRNDKEIIINAVIGAQSSNYFNLIPEHFWNDKTVVLKAIENDEDYLEFASQEIQDLCQDFDPIDFDPIETLTKAIEVEKLHKELEGELPPTEQQIEPTRKKLKKI